MESTSSKFQLIYDIVSKEDNVLKIKELCRIAGVSRSGYYNWVASIKTRNRLEEKNKAD